MRQQLYSADPLRMSMGNQWAYSTAGCGDASTGCCSPPSSKPPGCGGVWTRRSMEQLSVVAVRDATSGQVAGRDARAGHLQVVSQDTQQVQVGDLLPAWSDSQGSVVHRGYDHADFVVYVRGGDDPSKVFCPGSRFVRL